MVVGINPYYDKNGNGQTTQHLIFHFKDVPGNARMEATDTNQNGYLGSEMRKYLTPVSNAAGSGNYWAALQTAGVPDSVVWNISRRVTNKGSGANNTHTIEDKLWLPTNFELTSYPSTHDYETDANQGRFAYYDDDSKRVKASKYWLSSPYYYSADFNSATDFFEIWSNGTSTYYINASAMRGCAPAFAVK
jgi:hypothetical protein